MVKSNDRKRARINPKRYVLGKFDYDNQDDEVVGHRLTPPAGRRTACGS